MIAIVVLMAHFAGVLPGASLSPGLHPQSALAADAVVSQCTEAGFDAALNTVQTTGGGTITFTCAGTITFTAEKSITSNVTINGGGQITFDGNNATRLFLVNADSSLSLDGLTFQNGNGNQSSGGAIYKTGGTLTISNSTFANNGSSFVAGGAIGNDGGMLTVSNSSFRDNQGNSGGGAILSRNSLESATLTVLNSTFTGNNGGFSGGGAIFAIGGTVNISRSAFAGNRVQSTFGGAIRNAATMTISDSTFSGNISEQGDGGAIRNEQTLTITSSTFSGNTAGFNGGAIFNSGTAGVVRTTITASILANNVATNGPNCFINRGSIVSAGSNLSNDDSCPFTAAGDMQNSANVNLGELADNGGPTQTFALLPNSDAVNNADCGLATAQDQRGIARPKGGGCDIGAFELQPPEVQTPVVTPSPSNEAQQVTATAPFTIPEPGAPGTISCTVDYGDGTGPQPGTGRRCN